jgi:hypothetical protein
MLQPKLTNFVDFIEKPKQYFPKTKHQVQNDINWYLNILIFLIILIGSMCLYNRYKTKEVRHKTAVHTIQKFNEYIDEYNINNMLSSQNNIQY